MVPQSASLERETRFAAGSQHTTTRTRSARSNDCGTNRLAGSPPPRWAVAPYVAGARLPAAETSRRADLCRSPPSARFVCGLSCVDWPPQTGFRARRTCFAAPGGAMDRLCRRTGPKQRLDGSQLVVDTVHLRTPRRTRALSRHGYPKYRDCLQHLHPYRLCHHTVMPPTPMVRISSLQSSPR